MLEELDLGVEPEKDVRAATLALKVAYQESGAPEDVLWVIALELVRDVEPRQFYRGRLGPARVEGAALTAHAIESDVVLMFPTARLALVGSPGWLGSALRDAAGRQEGRRPAPGPQDPIGQVGATTGELAFAGRMPDPLREACLQELSSWRSRRVKRGMGGEQVLEFALVYSLVQMARDAASAGGSLDFGRSGDALQVAIEFAGERFVRAAAGVAETLAEPLAIALPALFGGQPRQAPPPEPLYRVETEPRTVRVTMSRQAIEALAADLAGGPRRRARSVRSAANLRRLGAAAVAYAADRKAYPRTWSDLFAAGYLQDPEVLVNPDLKAHFPGSDYQLVPLSRPPGEKAFQTVLGHERWSGRAPPGGRLNVLFADGHVENLDFERFEQLLDLTYKTMAR
jgi:prepilin-type processing-associated H-X9-DG protein